MSSEDYIFDCADGEPVTCYEKRRVTARATHKCGECGHPIVPGEVYVKETGLCDGDWFTEKTCVCCDAARCAVADKYESKYDVCVMRGDLWNAIRCGIEEGWLKREDVGDVPASLLKGGSDARP